MKTTPPRNGQPSMSRRRIKTSAAVSLWRPEIVLATSLDAVNPRRSVVLAEPGARPDAIRTQLGAARSLLARLDGARESLSAVADAAQQRVAEAESTRDRVSATFAAYRAEAALDDVLTGAWRRVSALMEERGLR
jgi:hypothetical protein